MKTEVGDIKHKKKLLIYTEKFKGNRITILMPLFMYINQKPKCLSGAE